MFSTLRGRMIVSHIIPFFITVPIMGIALIYFLSNQLMLDETSQQLKRQAALVVELAQDQPGIWQDAAQAQDFVSRISDIAGVQVTLLDANWRTLASSALASSTLASSTLASSYSVDPIAADSIEQVITSTPTVNTSYSERLHAEVASIIISVPGDSQQPVGAIRLTDQLGATLASYQTLRTITIVILLAGFALSVTLGWVLALDLERPLNRVTRAVRVLADGSPTQPLPEGRIWEIDQLVQAFNTLSQRLRTSEETRQQLLANIVHELGRPLGALHSAVQALQNGADQTLRQELLGGMDEELQRLHRLLQDLTQVNQQPAQMTELHCYPVIMSEWLPAILAPRRELAQAKDITWQTYIPSDLPNIDADSDRVGQALGNLLHNAIDYTPPGGVVQVEAGAQDDKVWVSVRDTGPGMTLEERARAFDLFHRGHSVASHAPGMGLGLTIARDVVAAHGGRLELKSTPGTGCVFILWLPIHSPACD